MSARIKKEKLTLRENTFYGSSDSDYIGLMNEDGSLCSDDDPLTQHTYLETHESSSIEYKDLSNVTYKLIPVAAHEETIANMQSSPSHGTYYVQIDDNNDNPIEVFATNAPSIKLKDIKSTRSPTAHASKASAAKKRDDKRRETHNEVERRRRCKINTWIMKLGSLVPNSGTPDSASKGGILAKACDYITELNEKQKRLEKLEVENEKLVLEVLTLNQELADLRKENNSVRNQLADSMLYSHRTKEDKS